MDKLIKIPCLFLALQCIYILSYLESLLVLFLTFISYVWHVCKLSDEHFRTPLHEHKMFLKKVAMEYMAVVQLGEGLVYLPSTSQTQVTNSHKHVKFSKHGQKN